MDKALRRTLSGILGLPLLAVAACGGSSNGHSGGVTGPATGAGGSGGSPSAAGGVGGDVASSAGGNGGGVDGSDGQLSACLPREGGRVVLSGGVGPWGRVEWVLGPPGGDGGVCRWRIPLTAFDPNRIGLLAYGVGDTLPMDLSYARGGATECAAMPHGWYYEWDTDAGARGEAPKWIAACPAVCGTESVDAGSDAGFQDRTFVLYQVCCVAGADCQP
jgi:hypothetical protein